MRTRQAPAKDIDEYIRSFPSPVQEALEKVRTTIRNAAPEAEERISYQIPAFNLHGRYLVYFAGYKNHVGVYPAPLDNEELKEELAPYASGKGTVRFRLDRPIPEDVIRKIVEFRAKENLHEKRRTANR